jgi:CheY-like chemotaxis protein
MTTRVLVVEDDPAIQELIRFTLEKAGLKAAVAASAEEALTALKAALPDVVLIDWMLPKMSGLALARQLREAARTEKLPLIMVTARGEEADRVAGLEQGADDYLVKPFSPRELVARIQAVLRRRAPHAAETTLVFGPLHLDPDLLRGDGWTASPSSWRRPNSSCCASSWPTRGACSAGRRYSTRCGATMSSSRNARWTCISAACARPWGRRASS